MNDTTTIYKFDENCRPIPYYGNTVISLLDHDSDIFRACLEVQDQMKQWPWSDHLAFLPQDSFHMTVLGLCREIDRHTREWPTDVPDDASFSQIDRIIQNRMMTVPVPRQVCMEIDQCEINRVVLRPHDEQSLQQLLTYRDAVSQATGIRHDNHAGFHFHISLNYVVHSLTPAQNEAQKLECQEFTRKLRQSVSPFLIPAPEFTVFNDMLHFDRSLSYRGSLY